MKRKANILLSAFLIILLFFIYKSWFILPQIIGGDWPYYSPQILKDLVFPPIAWVFWQGNGLGGIDVTYSLHIYEHFTVLLGALLHIPWTITYKIFWFGLFLVLTIFSTNYLYN